MSFFSHPSQVCMTYFEHARLSAGLGILFAVASFKAFVHALIPDIFIKSSSTTVTDAAERLKKAGCRDSTDEGQEPSAFKTVRKDPAPSQEG